MDMTIVCVFCSKSFNVPFRKNKIGKIKFCSLTCAGLAIKKPTEDKPCIECGKIFTSIIDKKKVFCSDVCYQSNRKSKKGFLTCEVCHSKFETTSTRKNTARFCSQECKMKDNSWKAIISEKISGSNNWRWAGGKTKEMKAAYNKQAYRKILEEDIILKAPDHPFLIMRNGKKVLSRRIHVHHIDRNPLNNSLDNLLAVTIDAHARIHHNGTKPRPWECWPSDPVVW